MMMVMMMRVRWVGVMRRAQGQINAAPRCPLPCNIVGSQRCSWLGIPSNAESARAQQHIVQQSRWWRLQPCTQHRLSNAWLATLCNEATVFTASGHEAFACVRDQLSTAPPSLLLLEGL